MTATIENISGEPDIDGEPKTYDILIEHKGHRYFKFGMTSQALRRRFASEPAETLITIRRIWRHKTVQKAEIHERRLFRTHKGDLPFIGKMGPLVKGGNTEVFSHDVMNGEAAPHTFKVVLYSESGFPDRFMRYADYDPFSRWETQYFWVKTFNAPAFEAVVVPQDSDHLTLTVASVSWLEDLASGALGFSKRKRLWADEALSKFEVVTGYDTAYYDYGGVDGTPPNRYIFR